MFKDFNNEEEKKSDFICIYLIALDNAVLYRFPRKQALRTKGIRWRRRWFFYYSIISIILLLLVYNFIDYYLSTILILRNLNFNEIIFLNVILGMFLGFLGSSKALSSYVKD